MSARAGDTRTAPGGRATRAARTRTARPRRRTAGTRRARSRAGRDRDAERVRPRASLLRARGLSSLAAGTPVRHSRGVAEGPRADRRAAPWAAATLAPVDAVPRGRAGKAFVHQARGG